MGGRCKICSDNSSFLMPNSCYCNSGYVLVGNSCKRCQNNCQECEFIEKTNSTKCLRCKTGYTFNSMNECIPCDEGCKYCYLNEKNISTCLVCENKFIPNEKKKFQLSNSLY